MTHQKPPALQRNYQPASLGTNDGLEVQDEDDE